MPRQVVMMCNIAYGRSRTRICVATVIGHCGKAFNQWQHSFHLKAALPLARKLATVSDHCGNKTGSNLPMQDTVECHYNVVQFIMMTAVKT